MSLEDIKWRPILSRVIDYTKAKNLLYCIPRQFKISRTKYYMNLDNVHVITYYELTNLRNENTIQLSSTVHIVHM